MGKRQSSCTDRNDHGLIGGDRLWCAIFLGLGRPLFCPAFNIIRNVGGRILSTGTQANLGRIILRSESAYEIDASIVRWVLQVLGSVPRLLPTVAYE